MLFMSAPFQKIPHGHHGHGSDIRVRTSKSTKSVKVEILDHSNVTVASKIVQSVAHQE